MLYLNTNIMLFNHLMLFKQTLDNKIIKNAQDVL
jgi:hypothetical protein